MGHSEGSTQREVHSTRSLPKKNRNISNKQFNPIPTRTQGIKTKTTQSKYKEGNSHDQAELNNIETKSTILGSMNPGAGSLKT